MNDDLTANVQGPNDWNSLNWPRSEPYSIDPSFLTEELNKLINNAKFDSKINEFLGEDQDYAPFIEKILEKTLEKILEKEGMEVLKELFQRRDSFEIQSLRSEVLELKGLVQELTTKLSWLEGELSRGPRYNDWNTTTPGTIWKYYGNSAGDIGDL